MIWCVIYIIVFMSHVNTTYHLCIYVCIHVECAKHICVNIYTSILHTYYIQYIELFVQINPPMHRIYSCFVRHIWMSPCIHVHFIVKWTMQVTYVLFQTYANDIYNLWFMLLYYERNIYIYIYTYIHTCV